MCIHPVKKARDAHASYSGTANMSGKPNGCSGACLIRPCPTSAGLLVPNHTRSIARSATPFVFPPQLVEQYQSLSEALQRLQRVQLDKVDTVGAGGNVQWVSAAFAFFLTVIVVEALGRTVANVIVDSEYDRDPREPSEQYMEKFIETEMLQQPPVIDLKTQLEYEKFLRESQSLVASRESSITLILILWALFTFSIDAFNRTPDLPLQP